MTYRPLHHQFRAQREALGISQVQLAKMVDMEQHAISRFECGRTAMTTRTLDRLCSALGLTLQQTGGTLRAVPIVGVTERKGKGGVGVKMQEGTHGH